MYISNVIYSGFVSVPVNIGYPTIGANTGTYTGITAVQGTLAVNAKLTSLTMRWNLSTGVSFLLGLYSDSGGVPSTLLASSALGSSTAGWQTLPIASGPTLAPGNYWIAVQNQTGVAGTYDTPVGALGAFNNGVTWTGTLPSSWPTGSTGVFAFSMYATLSPT
jgi:hypothetical protein